MSRGDAYPRAILHFDGDSFFASIEQAKDWRLRGRPVITGGERGAATSLSYEAKRLGLHRGMPMREIRRLCPEAAIVSSDYTAYSIYARRMYAIVRGFADRVEEYSIDECFADITGLDERLGIPYEDIACSIKAKLQESLGITFGVGLASTKTLAKTASKRKKPNGFTAMPMERIEECLEDTQIYDIWGLGGAMSAKLRALGVITALDYIRKPDAWLKEHGFGKPARDTWLELKGYPVLGLGGKHAMPHSVMKTRTFTPPSTDRAFILAQLSRNVEAACAKLRRARMSAHAISFYLKTQEFTYHGVQIDLPHALSTPPEMLALIASRFDGVYAEDILYRATGVTLRSLVADVSVTPDLFGAHAEQCGKRSAFAALDLVNRKYGRGTILLGSSLAAASDRKERNGEAFLSPDIERKKSLDIPYLGIVH